MNLLFRASLVIFFLSLLLLRDHHPLADSKDSFNSPVLPPTALTLSDQSTSTFSLFITTATTLGLVLTRLSRRSYTKSGGSSPRRPLKAAIPWFSKVPGPGHGRKRRRRSSRRRRKEEREGGNERGLFRCWRASQVKRGPWLLHSTITSHPPSPGVLLVTASHTFSTLPGPFSWGGYRSNARRIATVPH